ncbi:MAG: class I SAM-dependent methyltransferase [bacterium]|jgi:predicted methyltransferase|nr:methyltransferase [Betaproteobacteria bacterium]
MMDQESARQHLRPATLEQHPSSLPDGRRRGIAASLALIAAPWGLASALSGCATQPGGSGPASGTGQALTPAQLAEIEKVLASPARPDADRKADVRRQPADLLRLAMVRPGMRVLDIWAGGGYTTQVMSAAAGSTGKVWAHTPTVRPPLEARAKAPGSNIEVLVRPTEDPYPANLPRVDLVTLILSYHDIVNTPTDRMKMNRALLAALRPGGRLVVMDHSARDGAGLSATETFHRIEEAVMRKEIEAAGFVFEADSAAWRNKADPRDTHWNQAKPSSDKFALRFVRPR